MHEIPGSHLDLMREPNVVLLAHELNACLERFAIARPGIGGILVSRPKKVSGVRENAISVNRTVTITPWTTRKLDYLKGSHKFQPRTLGLQPEQLTPFRCGNVRKNGESAILGAD